MEKYGTGHGNLYRIKVKEMLDPNVTVWFGGMTVSPLENGGTLLTGPFPDQPALRGFLTQLWNLNFRGVHRKGRERLPPGTGEMKKARQSPLQGTGPNHPAGAHSSRLPGVNLFSCLKHNELVKNKENDNEQSTCWIQSESL